MAQRGVLNGETYNQPIGASPPAVVDLTAANYAPGYSTNPAFVSGYVKDNDQVLSPTAIAPFAQTDRLICAVMSFASSSPTYVISSGWSQLFNLSPGDGRSMAWFEYTGGLPADPVASWASIAPQITPSPAPKNTTPNVQRYNTQCIAIRGTFTDALQTGTKTDGLFTAWTTTPNVTTTQRSLSFGWIYGGRTSGGPVQGTDFSPLSATQNGWKRVQGQDASSWQVYTYTLAVNDAKDSGSSSPPAAITWETSEAYVWVTFALADPVADEWGVGTIRF